MNRCNHNFPTISHIVNFLSLNEKDIIAIYVLGSHLWQTCTDESDIDLVIIVKDSKTTNKFINIHKNNIDALILHESHYTELIDLYTIHIMMTCWLPDRYYIKHPSKTSKIKKFNKDIFMKTLEELKDRDLKISNKHYIKKNIDQSKKVILHLIKYLLLAIQIKNNNRIDDYTCGEQYIELKDKIENIYTNYNFDFKEIESIVHDMYNSIVL
jgi:predicted nucleotidyltransferase